MSAVYQLALCAFLLGGTAYQWFHIGRMAGRAASRKILTNRVDALLGTRCETIEEARARDKVIRELLDASEEIGRGG